MTSEYTKEQLQDQVNILCARVNDNDKEVKRLGKLILNLRHNYYLYQRRCDFLLEVVDNLNEVIKNINKECDNDDF